MAATTASRQMGEPDRRHEAEPAGSGAGGGSARATVRGAVDPASALHRIVAHELRGALAGIAANLELLIDPRVGSLTDEQMQCVDAIASGVERARQLVDAAVGAAEAGSADRPLDPVPVDVSEIARRAVAEFAPRCASADQELRLSIAEDAPAAWADPIRVAQIVDNLLSNAHFHTPRGTRIDVSLAAEPGSGDLVLAVSDDGPGLSGGEIARLSEGGYRASEARQRHPGGAGVGVRIARDLAARLSGELSIRSEAGMGCTFRVRLPRPPDR